MQGRLRKPAHLRVIGSPAARHVPIDPGKEVKPEFDNGFKPPRKLSKAEQVLWDCEVRSAPWLTKWDVQRAFMWVNLTCRFNKDPESFNSTMIGQLRGLGSELGFDPAARTRVKVPESAKSSASKYFDSE